MIQLLFSLLYHCVQIVQPLLVPICFIFAWGITVLFLGNMWFTVRDSIAKAKQMHQIPCANCQFFTGDYRLKCPVRPTIALSEEAINCSDYEAWR